jgi:CheY-like chemotaxis protein
MSKQKALLVDDSKSARFFLRNLLQKNKIEVDMAESGEAALEYLKNHRPDIIFMDHLMPGIDGFETTKSIKGNPDTSGIPVVMCTSNEGEEYAQQAKDIGASEILPKPPTEDKLRFILQDISQPAVTPAPASGPPSGLSAEEIETLARNAAQAAVEQALEPLLEKLLSSRLAQLRQDLQEQGRTQTEELVGAAIGRNSAELRDEVLTAARQESESLASAAAERAVSGLLESRGQEIQAAAQRSAAESVDGFRGEWKAEKDSLMGEAAQMLAGAKEAAADAAEQSARAVAEEVATQVAGEAATQITRKQTASAGSGEAQAKRFAGMAALAGILSALLVYFIK